MNKQKIFNEIAQDYDKNNNYISLFLHKVIKKHAISMLNIMDNSIVLDVCTGTGDIVQIIEKINKTSKVIGLDFSESMLKFAKKKNPKGVYLKGNCEDLIFTDNEFDYVTSTFGLRNVENRKKALKEIYRVLKPNGKFLHLDFGYHNLFSKIFDFIVLLAIKILKISNTNYKYLLYSKNTFPQPDELIQEFESIGFRYSKKTDYLFGIISCQIMKK